MLGGRRARRVGDEILRWMARLLSETVRDPRVEGVTLTGIRLSNDLKVAKVYYSIMGEGSEIERAQTGLDSAKSFIKREMGSGLSLKYIPEITFIYDAALERGSHLERIFEKMQEEK